jgi:hypothetical protein
MQYDLYIQLFLQATIIEYNPADHISLPYHRQGVAGKDSSSSAPGACCISRVKKT